MPLLLLYIPFFSEANAHLLVFLKIGAILYGSGYVLFAFLDSELVAKGLLTRTQLVDAIAVGQFTPGPVFSSVTFIGWQMNGPLGALLQPWRFLFPLPFCRIVESAGAADAEFKFVLCVPGRCKYCFRRNHPDRLYQFQQRDDYGLAHHPDRRRQSDNYFWFSKNQHCLSDCG